MPKLYRQFAITSKDQPSSLLHVAIFANRIVLDTRAKGSSVFFYSGKKLIGIVDLRDAMVQEFVNDRTVLVKELEAARQAASRQQELDQATRETLAEKDVPRG